MEDKLIKQNIDRLDISDNAIKILKDNKIITLGQLCKKSKSDLKKIEIEVMDTRKYGRATLIFLKIRKG